MQQSRARHLLSYAVKVSGLLAAYLITARLGLRLDAVSGFATLVWAPTGIALFALLTSGYRLWPGVFAGALIANLLTGAPVPVALGIASGNTAEALLAVWLLRRAGFDRELSRVHDVAVFSVLAAAACTLVSATTGATSLWAGGVVSTTAFAPTWKAWWLGDALGALTVAPLLLVWSRRVAALKMAHVAEALLLAACLLGLTWGVFSGAVPNVLESPFGWPYFVFPGLFWAALRFTQRGAVTATFAVAVVTIAATATGHGPFARPVLSESLILVQVFMAVSSVTALMLAAAVSERDRARSTAEESQQQFQTLADSIPHLAWVADAGGSIRWFNRRWYDYTGATPRALEREEASGWLRGNAGFQAALAAGEPWEQTLPLRRSDGVPRRHLSRAVPVRDADGRVVKWFGTHTDVEEQQEFEEKLSEALRVREDFLAVAGHELKTPLAALLMHLESLGRARKAGSLPENLDQRLEKARGSALRLGRLIDQLLDVSRIAAGRLELERERFELDVLLVEVVERFAVQAERAGCTLSLVKSASSCGLWDRARIDQVLSNLLSNAIKYGAGKPIDVELWEEGGEAIVRVTDRGIGIEADQQQRIFGRFERAVSAREFGGFGLGLWISRQVAEASGGRIEVQSAPGEGSTFTLRLPLGAAEAPHAVH